MLNVGRRSVPAKALPAAIEGSWARCQARGMRRSDVAALEPVDIDKIRQLMRRDAALLDAVCAELQALTPALQGTSHMAFVVDDLGFVIAVAGDAPETGSVLEGVKCGVNLSEGLCGTNAAGTALIERQPTLVRRGEHYLTAFNALDCFAAPIVGANGKLLGVLTISNSAAPQVPGVVALTQVAVARIERQLVHKLESPLLLAMHPHIEGLGYANEGLLALASDGEILGLNSAAAQMLGGEVSGLVGRGLRAVFEGNPMQAISGDLGENVVLRVKGGLCVRARITRNVVAVHHVEGARKYCRQNPLRDDLRLIEALSKRELQILNSVKMGLSNSDIAKQTFISEDTVKYHLKNVFSKLGAKNRLEAVSIARELGLILGEVQAPVATASRVPKRVPGNETMSALTI